MVSRLTIRIIQPLRDLIRRCLEVSKNTNILTPFHASFSLACLHAKCYFAAIPILKQYVYMHCFIYINDYNVWCSFRPIFEISNKEEIRAVDVLEYYYYSGMLYCGLKQFGEAADCFLMVSNKFCINLRSYLKIYLLFLFMHDNRR